MSSGGNVGRYGGGGVGGGGSGGARRTRSQTGHPENVKYRDLQDDYTFMVLINRVPRWNLQYFFDFCNQRFFDGSLRRWTIRYSTNLRRVFGYTSKHEKIINISRELVESTNRPLSVLIGTIIHECVHAFLYENPRYYPQPDERSNTDIDREQEEHGPVFCRLFEEVREKASHFNFALDYTDYEHVDELMPNTYCWRCTKCGMEKKLLISRDINEDRVLNRYHSCWVANRENNRELWQRINFPTVPAPPRRTVTRGERPLLRRE